MIPSNDQVAVGLHCHRPAGGGLDAADGGDASSTVNRRLERLARYRSARRRVAPSTSRKAFELLVAEVLDELPGAVRERLDNVAVVVEERGNSDLLGLYEGVNQLDRSSGYHLVAPDRITLFWKPILEEVGSADPELIRREVRKTIIHEVAHHFGMDDAELERLGG
jgi:predicted Zn-dependent protease with MMP-like domain